MDYITVLIVLGINIVILLSRTVQNPTEPLSNGAAPAPDYSIFSPYVIGRP